MAEQDQGSQGLQERVIDTTYVRQHAAAYASRGKLPQLRAHNSIACLNTAGDGIGKCKEIMLFLQRSRIYKAISEEPLVYRNHIEDFWDTATVDSVVNPTKINAKVAGTKMVFTEGILRRVLEFGDDVNDPTAPSQEKVRGCLTRCGYPELTGTVNKRFFSPPFKYLAHVLIHCLSAKKAGTDTLNESLQSAYAALVMNMNFNFTRMIWNSMTEAASNKRVDFDFLLYPRFVQMMINSVRPFLTKDGDILPIAQMDDTTVRYMFNYNAKQAKPRDAVLWGHLINENYLCPPGATWSNAGSDYEDEVIIVEPPKTKTSRGKRKQDQHVDEVLEVTGTAEPTKKRRATLAWKPRPTATPTPAPSSSTGTPDAPPSSSNPEATPQRTTEDAPSLQSSLVSLLARVERIEAENREKREEVKKLVDEKAEMNNKIEDMHLLLLRANAKNEQLAKKNEELESRVKAMELCYDDNQKVMVLDKDGYFRHADHVDEEDLMMIETDADGAGTSAGTSHL